MPRGVEVNRPLRVLHCPELVGGNARSLAAAERSIGLDSRAVALAESPFGYRADETLAPAGTSILRREALRWRLLGRALAWADIVHFNFGSTTMPSRWVTAVTEQGANPLRSTLAELYARVLEGLDLPLLRAWGVAVAVTFQGSDARPARLSPGWDASPDLTHRVDRLKRGAIARLDRHAVLIYALNPDLLSHLPERARFLPYANVDLAAVTPAPPPPRPEAPVVVHAPTHRGVKGTSALLAASERLRARGVAHELRLIEGVSHERARAMLTEADIVVDQLRIGWYGGVAVEAMALAKPLIVHLGERDLAAVPSDLRDQIPAVQATEDTIEGVLEELLTGPRTALGELGLRGRAYVERWHDPVGIARGLAADYARVARRAQA
jgi:hypothetical protein